MNYAPGILALEVDSYFDPATQKEEIRGVPFVVPGARFNELYGWDSYFIVLGLLRSERQDLARGIIRNFCFCIEHYGKVFNANRTYYLGRSQPPFLTDMALSTFNKIKHESDSLDLLRLATWAAIKEYKSVWTTSPRLDPVTGLSRYQATGVGVPSGTEKSHFIHLLTPYAKKHNLGIDEFIRAYNHGEISEPELDEYFLHDRSLPDSGHDTSYRLERVCADLVTMDLNSLLYKYETDIAYIIREYFDDTLEMSSRFAEAEYTETFAPWDHRAKFRRCQTATPRQAALLIKKALPRFESFGGLVACTEASRGKYFHYRR